MQRFTSATCSKTVTCPTPQLIVFSLAKLSVVQFCIRFSWVNGFPESCYPQKELVSFLMAQAFYSHTSVAARLMADAFSK